MTLFRSLLIVFSLAIFGYTLVTMTQHGADFLSVYFATVLSGTWAGQFTFDFSLYLALSALWIAWRGGFAGSALALAACAGVFGMLVFGPYLLIQLRRSEGDLQRVLLGVHAR